jgi:hypothetical protein
MAEFNKEERFNNLLRARKPLNFDALIQSMKTPSNNHSEEGMQHFYFAYLNVWTDEADILNFMRCETEMGDLVGKIVVSSNNLGMEAVRLKCKQQRLPVFLCPCLGCNTPYDNGEEHAHRGSPQKCKIADYMPEEIAKLAGMEVHQSVCHLSGVISLLTWIASEDEDSPIKERQDYLINLLIDPRPLIVAPSSLITPLASILGLIDNCSQCNPKCAHMAATLLSLIVSNRPSRCLSQLDPEFVIPAMYNYIAPIFPRISNAECLVEEYYGITQILNVIPLLYYLGDWRESTVFLKRSSLPMIVATLAVNILHSSDIDNRLENPRVDCPPNLNHFGELKGAIVFVSNLFGIEGSAHMKAKPLTFTVVALVETLSRWKLHGIEDNNDNNDRADTVQDCFLEYLPHFEILVKRFPHFSFVLPIAKAFAAPKGSKENKQVYINKCYDSK